MLILSLKDSEGLVIGDLVHVRVFRSNGHLKLGITAPKEVTVLRDSLPDGARSAKRICGEKHGNVR